MAKLMVAYAPWRLGLHRIAIDLWYPYVIGFRRPLVQSQNWWSRVDIDLTMQKGYDAKRQWHTLMVCQDFAGAPTLSNFSSSFRLSAHLGLPQQASKTFTSVSPWKRRTANGRFIKTVCT